MIDLSRLSKDYLPVNLRFKINNVPFTGHATAKSFSFSYKEIVSLAGFDITLRPEVEYRHSRHDGTIWCLNHGKTAYFALDDEPVFTVKLRVFTPDEIAAGSLPGRLPDREGLIRNGGCAMKKEAAKPFTMAMEINGCVYKARILFGRIRIICYAQVVKLAGFAPDSEPVVKYYDGSEHNKELLPGRGQHFDVDDYPCFFVTDRIDAL